MLIFIVLASLSAVSAADDAASDIVSADDEKLILDEAIDDDVSSANDNYDDELILEDNSEDAVLDRIDEESKLSETSPGTFADLNNDINGNVNSTIYLTRNYTYAGEGDHGEVDIDRPMTIYGNGITIDGSNSQRIFYICSDDVTLNGINFINGYQGQQGGAIYIVYKKTNVVFVNCTFINNTAGLQGGAIFIPSQNPYVAADCRFIHNTAVQGGGMYLGSATLCTFENSDCFYTNFVSSQLSVSDFTTAYNSGEKLLFDMIADNTKINTFSTRIQVYNKDDDLMGTYYALTGEDNGWVVDLSPGTYKAVLSLDSHPEVEPVNATLTINKAKAGITPTNPAIDLFVGDSSKVEYTLTPTDSGDITFTSNNPNVVTVDSTGKIKAISEGTATITISLTSDNYEASDTTVNVAVSKKATKLTASAVTTTYNVAKDLVITLKDVDGNLISGAQITVDLNGAKKYTTDKNGQVKVAVGKLVPKTYTAKISFAGDANYKASSTTAKVTVKKATPKLTAKAKTFKFEDKTKKYKVTLKDNKGNALKNKKVTLKVKGKTYSANTNNKGVATFKLTKLNKKGKFNAVITYAGDKYYKKATKKAKVTVKAPAKKKSAWKTVAKGSKDKATVKKIQKALKNNGYYLTYKGHYLKIDGIYKGCTERSVKQFQKAKGLKVTGKVDEKTAKKLKLI